MLEHSSTDKVGFDSKSPDERLLPAKYRGGPRTPHHAGVRSSTRRMLDYSSSPSARTKFATVRHRSQSLDFSSIFGVPLWVARACPLEGERIERETVRYANLTLMASATTKIISDAVSQWHPASNQQNASEVTAASTQDDIGAFRKSHHHRPSDPSELGQAADVTEGTPTHAKV